MELIYLYIKKFGDFIYEQEIQFSNDFEIFLKDQKLIINKKQNLFKNYYGKNVNNISVLVGKNGSGKTTILDILGMNRQDRLRTSIIKNKVEDEYFLLYYLGTDDRGEDLFGIEVTGENILNNIITNCDNADGYELYDKSKVSIGKVYKYVNEKWISIKRHFFDYNVDKGRLSDLIRYTYIGEKYRYSNRNEIYRGYSVTNGGYIARRAFNSEPSVYEKYLTLVKCIAGKIKGFDCDKVKIKFEDTLNAKIIINDEDLEKYENKITEISKELLIWEKISILGNSDKKNHAIEKKERYIFDLYSRYIIDMIVNGLYYTCKNNKSEESTIEIETHMDYIKSLDSHTSSEEKLGKATNFEMEINQIKILISKLKYDFGNDMYLVIKTTTRYIGSRMHSVNEQDEFAYVSAFECIIDGLYKIPEEYFNGNGVEILVRDERIYDIEILLRNYSKYTSKIGNKLYSDIGNKFKIMFELLSEGEERFLDIITKLYDTIASNEESKLLVILMDEPDQSLHPEWSRRFIDVLLQVIESIKFNGNIQLVISTHSPYLLSDILPDDVFLLEREKESRRLNMKKLDISEETSCLGANIYDLMKNEFFMNNTVGEFATKKINEYMRKINGLNTDIENTEEIESFIERIGDTIIKKVMMKQLQKKKDKLTLIKNKQTILDMITNDNDKERVKMYLQTIKD